MRDQAMRLMTAAVHAAVQALLVPADRRAPLPGELAVALELGAAKAVHVTLFTGKQAIPKVSFVRGLLAEALNMLRDESDSKKTVGFGRGREGHEVGIGASSSEGAEPYRFSRCCALAGGGAEWLEREVTQILSAALQLTGLMAEDAGNVMLSFRVEGEAGACHDFHAAASFGMDGLRAKKADDPTVPYVPTPHDGHSC